MPTYSYRCPHGHEVEHFGRMRDEQPATVRCETHGCDATRGVTASALAGVAPTRPLAARWEAERAQRQQAPDLGMFDYACPEHGAFDDIVDFRKGETAEAPRPCPTCGTASPQTFTIPEVEATLTMYPYYDRGLGPGDDGRGVLVESKQHRRRLMEERNLVEVGGDWDYARECSNKTLPARQAQEKFKELQKKYDDSPAMRAWKDRYKQEHVRDYVPM